MLEVLTGGLCEEKYIGEYYEIAETAEKVYIGSDFPDEFTHSKYTKVIKLEPRGRVWWFCEWDI